MKNYKAFFVLVVTMLLLLVPQIGFAQTEAQAPTPAVTVSVDQTVRFTHPQYGDYSIKVAQLPNAVTTDRYGRQYSFGYSAWYAKHTVRGMTAFYPAAASTGCRRFIIAENCQRVLPGVYMVLKTQDRQVAVEFYIDPSGGWQVSQP